MHLLLKGPPGSSETGYQTLHRTSQIFKTVYLTDPYGPIKRPRQFMPDAPSLIAGNLLKSAPQTVNHQL